jgi:hypothetical protein
MATLSAQVADLTELQNALQQGIEQSIIDFVESSNAKRGLMKYIREQDVKGDRIGSPHQRVIRHLVTPENMGSQHLWLGTSSVDPGFTRGTRLSSAGL